MSFNFEVKITKLISFGSWNLSHPNKKEAKTLNLNDFVQYIQRDLPKKQTKHSKSAVEMLRKALKSHYMMYIRELSTKSYVFLEKKEEFLNFGDIKSS